jgi:hypothetical protein
VEDDGAFYNVSNGDGDEVESPENTISSTPLSNTERLKHKLRGLRAIKTKHDLAGEQLTRDIKDIERRLLDAICNES